MHEEWTDRLSDYLDGELPDGEAAAVDAHLRGCTACNEVLNDLKRVVARAEAAASVSRPPQTDLWSGIAARIEPPAVPAATPRGQVAVFAPRAPRRISLSLSQFAAAAALVAAVSGGLVWQWVAGVGKPDGRSGTSSAQRGTASEVAQPFRTAAPADGAADPDNRDARTATIGLADAQYDAAVADLEQALKTGRGRLDASTIAVVEHNLQIIDQAINQAREALIGDPANSYLSSHLVEARRRKLDLLRRATALTTDMD
jgi:hypothetical protein